MAGREQALTAAQKRERSKKEISKMLLNLLNSKQGGRRMNKQEFSRELGISDDTWRNWNDKGLLSVDFGKVLDAVLKSGLKMNATGDHGKVILEISL